MNWHDILERAYWTFIQGTVGTITVVPIFTDVAGWKSLALAGSAGGFGAVLSMLKTISQEKLEGFDTR